MSTMKLVYLSWKIASIISINSCSNSIELCISHFLVINATWCSAKNGRKRKHSMNLYPARRVFSLAWLLTLTKSFAWLVCRVVGSMQDRNFCSQGTEPFDFHFRFFNGFIANYQKQETLKIKMICFSPKVSIQPCRSKSDQPFLEPFELNLGQKSSIKRLFQPTVGPILALGPNQP